jgi:hypothetical protein
MRVTTPDSVESMAKLPALRYCLIAEQLRPEANRKMTILGFFGISPDVEIKVPHFPAALTLAALFLFEEAASDGTTKIEVSVSSSSGFLFPITQGPDLVQMEKGRGASIAMGFQSLPIREPGRISINVYVDRVKQCEASLKISLLEPD